MHPLDSAWEAVKKDFDAACSQSARAARGELTNNLNQLLRRLRQYRDEQDWGLTLMESVGRFVPEAAIFDVDPAASGDRNPPFNLCLRAQIGMNLPSGFKFAAGKGAASAAAFSTAIDTRDPVVALRSAAEVTAELESKDSAARAHVLPLLNQDRVVAVLFAAGSESIDANALELISGIASIVLERGSNRNLHTQIAAPAAKLEREGNDDKGAKRPGKKAAAQSGSKPAAPPISNSFLPDWADLPDAERARHIQAQRFARVTIAELQLAQPEVCRSGRENGNLFVYLKRDLDRARDAFRKQFMETPSMVDYLHLELINTAAAGDESKLGEDYPGPLA